MYYSEPYPGNMQCDYTVHVSRGSTVLIQLTDIGMEVSSDCSYDYVSVCINSFLSKFRGVKIKC